MMIENCADADPQADARPQPLPRGDGLLWQQLLADLRRRLELRAFDSSFPGELALVAEYQVSTAVDQRGRFLQAQPGRYQERLRLAGPEPLALDRVWILERIAAPLASNGALLLDVREPDEWRIGHIADAVHMPLGDLRPESVPRDRVVVAVCRSGNRSGTAGLRLAAAGVDVRNLAGGLKAWAEAGLPITTDDGAPGTVG